MPAFLAFFLSATTPLNLTLTASPPQEPVPPAVSGDSRGYWFGAEDDGRPAQPTGEPSGSVRSSAPTDSEEEQSIGPHKCRSAGDDVQICTPVRGEGSRAKVSPAELAMAKWARLPIPAPHVRTAPPRQGAGLVGLPEWFWVTNWRSLSGRASAGGVWVEVTAVPQRTTINPGNGRRVVRCPGPGTTYDPTESVASQRTNCSYVYARSSAAQPRGTYRVRATVLWGGTWRGSDGSSGVLPPLSRWTIFRLRIAEAQGLYGGGAA